jgi:hypothetical protein
MGWSLAKGVVKWTGIVVLGLLALALLLAAIGFAINARDEELSPRAKALLAPPPNPYKAEDNIYLALAGFDAPSGSSITAAGQARIDQYNEKAAALPFDLAAASEPTVPGRLTFNGDVTFCQPLTASPWRDIPPHRDDVERLIADNAELYERYQGLPRLAGYYDTARPSYLAPTVSKVQGPRKLLLARVVLRLRSDDPALRRAALSELNDEIQLWRRVLTGHGDLISKMVAIVYLQGDYLLLADFIADAGAVVPTGPADGDALVPLFPLSDWNIADAFRFEFQGQDYMFRDLAARSSRGLISQDESPWARISNWLGAPFYKLHATENLFAEGDGELIAVTPVDPINTPQIRKWAADPGPGSSGVRLVYNPVGKILSTIWRPALEDYPLRAFDGAAFQRMVRLSYEIRRQRIPVADIPGFMREHPEWATHPGGGRPFRWDPNIRELRLQTLAHESPDRRFSILVWQAPAGH